MHEARSDPRLLDEHLLDLGIASVLGKDALDGVEVLGAIGATAAGTIDLGHATLGVQIQDLESGDHDIRSIAVAASPSQ
jgi:hypothetical protein